MKYIFIFLLLFSSCFHKTLYANKKLLIGLGAVSISSFGIYQWYKWFTKPEPFTPNHENLNILTFKKSMPSEKPLEHIDDVVKKIHSDSTPKNITISLNDIDALEITSGVDSLDKQEVVFLFSRGYARTTKFGTNDNFIQKGGCAMGAFIQYKDNIITNAPCITFDYPDHRRCFSFAQETDLSCLEFVHTEVLKKNPKAQIVLIGDCRGGKSILNFATKQPKNIKALVVFSPFISAKELTEQVAQNYLKWLPGASKILYGFFNFYFPNYKEEHDNLIENIKHIPSTIPIFIGHRKRDTLIAEETINRLVSELRKTGNKNIELHIYKDESAPHSKLTPIPELQKDIQSFFSRHRIYNDASNFVFS